MKDKVVMMNESKRIEKALNLLITITKGSKKKIKNWLEIAEETNFLVNNYGSIKKIAQYTGNSSETIRQIWKINFLTEENKKRVEKGTILMDAASRLSAIKESSLQNKVGKIIENMTSHDARDIIRLAKAYPDLSLEEIKKSVLESKPQREKLYFTLLPMDEKLHTILKNRAKKQKLSLENLILKIIKESVDEGKK